MDKALRWRRLFKPDGRILVVAMDHGGHSDKPLPGLEQPLDTIRKIVAGGADAVMTTYGTAASCAEALGQAALILTVASDPPMLELGVESALHLGADAVKCMVYPWLSASPLSTVYAARLGAECARWGMPFLAETIPGGFQAGPEMRTSDKIAAAARIGAEAGADFIKTFYTGEAETFRQVTANCPVPLVVLGGEKTSSDRECLEMVEGAIQGGAAGVAMGRNIWGHPDPERIAAAIAEILHGRATAEQALRHMEKRFAFG